MCEYDYDSLHIEIDNECAEKNIDPLDALSIWKTAIDVAFKEPDDKCRCYKFYKHQNSYKFCPECGRDLHSVFDFLNALTPWKEEGEKLFEIRKQKRIVMRKMAKITRYKPSELSHFEQGRKKPPDELFHIYINA